MARKVYVEVTARFDTDGRITPLSLTWEDGTVFEIGRVLDCRRAAGPDPDRARSLRSPSQVRDWAIIPAHLRWADRESVVPPLGLAV